MVDQVHAVVLSGGSAFGLDVASGVMRYLDERNIGWPVARGKVVPIVVAASSQLHGAAAKADVRDCVRRYAAGRAATKSAAAAAAGGVCSATNPEKS